MMSDNLTPKQQAARLETDEQKSDRLSMELVRLLSLLASNFDSLAHDLQALDHTVAEEDLWHIALLEVHCRVLQRSLDQVQAKVKQAGAQPAVAA